MNNQNKMVNHQNPKRIQKTESPNGGPETGHHFDPKPVRSPYLDLPKTTEPKLDKVIK